MSYVLPAYRFALVADLDQASRDPQEFKWRSVLKTGELVRTSPDARFQVNWLQERSISSTTARKNRSMELSEVVQFTGTRSTPIILAMCDITGLVFKILPDGRVFQRWAIAEGDGEEPKPFKTEWATVKDGLLYVGSTGKEWTVDGEIQHHNAEWVKIVDPKGGIDNIDWRLVYNTIRAASNTSYPGYMWHEAVHFDHSLRKWIFLPRKASSLMPYDPDNDELMGTNLLIVCSEDFTDIQVSHVGPLEPEYGFTALRRIPGSHGLYVAVKAKELMGVTHSKLIVFDLDGNLHSDWIEVGDMKFEGVEFVHNLKPWMTD